MREDVILNLAGRFGVEKDHVVIWSVENTRPPTEEQLSEGPYGTTSAGAKAEAKMGQHEAWIQKVAIKYAVGADTEAQLVMNEEIATDFNEQPAEVLKILHDAGFDDAYDATAPPMMMLRNTAKSKTGGSSVAKPCTYRAGWPETEAQLTTCLMLKPGLHVDDLAAPNDLDNYQPCFI